jgi:hypothetical protein
MCCLAEHTQANMVFQEVLKATEMQVVRNDVSKLKNWPIHEVFLVSMKPQSSRKFPWGFSNAQMNGKNKGEKNDMKSSYQ